MAQFRRLLIAMALALSTALLALPAGPAHAGSGERFCFPVIDESGEVVDWICVDIPVLVDPDPEPDPPCVCPWSIDFHDSLILPVEIQRDYLQLLTESLALMDQAARIEEQVQAYELREQAVDLFGEAALLLNGEQLELAEVGRGHVDDNVFEPDQDEWVHRAGLALAEGLSLVGQEINGPLPDPWREVALAQLDQAHHSLTRGLLGGNFVIRCFPVFDNGVIVDWVCVVIRVQTQPPFPVPDPVCLSCPWAIDFTEHQELPVELQRDYLRALADSLEFIDRAAYTQDPGEAGVLREQAVEAFGQAALVLEGGEVSLGETGRGQLRQDSLEPEQPDWLVEAGSLLSDGLTVVSQELAGPHPEPWEGFALEQLDQAYERLTAGSLN